MNVKLFLSNQWERIKVRVPAVVRNFPVASGVIFFAGFLIGLFF